jgi:cytochrome b561
MDPITVSRHAIAARSAQSPTGYTPVAILLHWAMTVLIAAMVGLGWYMTSIEEQPGSQRYFELHMSIGLIVAALLLYRVFWRLTHRPPALPATMPAWQRAAARATHGFLYAAMALMPITGFIGASLATSGVVFFGHPLPRWLMADHDAAEQLFSIHSLTATLLVAAVALHILAGLKHLMLDKDGVFQRMWIARPGLRLPSRSSIDEAAIRHSAPADTNEGR